PLLPVSVSVTAKLAPTVSGREIARGTDPSFCATRGVELTIDMSAARWRRRIMWLSSSYIRQRLYRTFHTLYNFQSLHKPAHNPAGRAIRHSCSFDPSFAKASNTACLKRGGSIAGYRYSSGSTLAKYSRARCESTSP